MRRLGPALLLVLLIGMFGAPAAPALAATITVNSTSGKVANDNDPNTCTLFEAVKAANQDQAVDGCVAGSGTIPDLITFSVSGQIKLEGTLFINSEIAIQGPIAISGDGNVSLFNVQSSGVLSLSTLTLEAAKNSAILNMNGDLNIVAVSFENNEANNGGAINSSGANSDINIAGSSFIGNKAADLGGAIRSTGGNLTIAASNFNGNSAGEQGGAIANDNANGRAGEISDSLFAGNVVEDSNDDRGGGAIANRGELTIIRSSFDGNLAPQANGGAISNGSDGVLLIRDSSLNGNLVGIPVVAERAGGAVYNQGELTVRRSLLLNNAAAGRGGGLANDRTGTVNLSNSTLVANAAGSEGGALANFNSQTGNQAGSTITVRNATITNSAAPNAGSAIFNGSGHTVALGNSIVADSATANCNTLLDSLGSNLVSDASCANAGSDQVVGDPLLGGLAFNGGPLAALLSRKPEPGSPAVDAGDPAICADAEVANEDQRGDPRPQDGDGNGSEICDIGAIESETRAAGYGSTPVQGNSINFGKAVAGQGTVSVGIEVFETGNAPLNVGGPLLSGSHPGDFAVTSLLPLTIADGANPQLIELTCTPTALGQRSATLILTTNDPNLPTVSYNLNCNGTETPVAGFGSAPPAPGPVSLGEALINVGVTKPISVFENGETELTVSNPSFRGANPTEFSVDLSNFPINISDGGAAQNIAVRCTPAAPGIRTAILDLQTNDPNQATVSFNLTCIGIDAPSPPLALTANSVANADIAGAFGPYGIIVSPNGAQVYAGDAGDALLTQFAWDAGSRQLSRQDIYRSPNETGLEGIRHLAFSPDGKYLYAAAANADAVLAFRRSSENGNLTQIDTVKQGDPVNCNFPNIPACPQFTGIDGAFDVVVSPDGRHVYVSSVNDDAVVVLERDQETGLLSDEFILDPPFGVYHIQTFSNPALLDEASGMAMSPDGKYLYVAGSSSDRIVILERNANSGEVSLVDSVADLDRVIHLAISPDGAHLYAALSNANSLVAFQRDPVDGRLNLVDSYVNGTTGISGLADPRSVTVDPAGKYVYVTGYDDDSLVVFERNSATGTLLPAQVISAANGGPALNGARHSAVRPDGSVVFVTAFAGQQVVALSRANPLPTLNSLSPGAVSSGSAGFTLSVKGSNFLPESQVIFGGTARPTSFINSDELRIEVSAADIAAAGSINVRVNNPAPGGGSSSDGLLVIQAPGANPIPTVDQLTPAGTAAGAGTLTVGIEGAGFLPGSVAQWNGSDRPTAYVSENYLEMQLSAANLAAPGQNAVSVRNPAPGGGNSNPVAFTVAAPGENPSPAISRLNPAFLTAGSLSGSSLEISVFGSNFVAGSQVQWNSEPRPTSYISPGELRVEVSAADLAEPGKADVSVVSPAPGGGKSNLVAFSIGASGDNPVPAPAAFSLADNGNGSYTLTLTGSGFVAGSQVRWNGADLPTTLISETELSALISLDALASGRGIITVVNPPPGGGSSLSLIYQANGNGPSRVWLPLVRR